MKRSRFLIDGEEGGGGAAMEQQKRLNNGGDATALASIPRARARLGKDTTSNFDPFIYLFL